LDLAAPKKRPVTKVITVLKDMLKQLEKEAEACGSRVCIYITRIKKRVEALESTYSPF